MDIDITQLNRLRRFVADTQGQLVTAAEGLGHLVGEIDRLRKVELARLDEAGELRPDADEPEQIA